MREGVDEHSLEVNPTKEEFSSSSSFLPLVF
jgi:hypothetical protein